MVPSSGAGPGDARPVADVAEATEPAGLLLRLLPPAASPLMAARREDVALALASAFGADSVVCAALMALNRRTAPRCASLRSSFSFSAPPSPTLPGPDSADASPPVPPLATSALLHCEKGTRGRGPHPAITSEMCPRSSRSCLFAWSCLRARFSSASAAGGGCSGRRGFVGAGAEMSDERRSPKACCGSARLRSGARPRDESRIQREGPKSAD